MDKSKSKGKTKGRRIGSLKKLFGGESSDSSSGSDDNYNPVNTSLTKPKRNHQTNPESTIERGKKRMNQVRISMGKRPYS
jgi:hypothetical protein